MDNEIIITHLANSGLAGQEQRFERDRITIGRDAQNDVDFDPDEDLLVSHKHAELYVNEGKLFIRDLESRNGTYVNHRRINDPTEVHPEDKIHFGAMWPLIKAKLGIEDAVPATIGKTIFDKMMGRMMSQLDAKTLGTEESAEMRPAGAVALTDPNTEAIRDQQSTPKAAVAVTHVPATTTRHRSLLPRFIGTCLLATALFTAGLAIGHLYMPILLDLVPTSERPTEASPLPSHVAALGRFEPSGGLLDIGGTSGLTVKSLLVTEGDFVSSGAPLAWLSSYDTLTTEYEYAVTTLEEAKRQLESTKRYASALVAEAHNGVEQVGTPLDLELQVVEAEIELLRAHLAVANEDLQKLEDLPGNSVTDQISRQRLVEQRARRDLAAASKRFEQLRESIKLRRDQAKVQLETAIANQKRLEESISIETAEKNVLRAKSQLEQAIVRSPQDGTILRIVSREGAALGGQPIVQLGDTRHFDVIAEVYETDVRRVAVGSRATINSAALPGELSGTVEQIMSMVEQNNMHGINPTALEDLRVVEVKIRLDDEPIEAHRDLLENLIQLQVDVRISCKAVSD